MVQKEEEKCGDEKGEEGTLKLNEKASLAKKQNETGQNKQKVLLISCY